MNITPQEYDKMSRSVSPKSRSIVNIPVAFAVGGAICVVGQLLLSLFEYYGFGKTAAGTWTSVILIGPGISDYGGFCTVRSCTRSD